MVKISSIDYKKWCKGDCEFVQKSMLKTVHWIYEVKLYSFVVRYIIFTTCWWSSIKITHYYWEYNFFIGNWFYENLKITKKFSRLASCFVRWTILRTNIFCISSLSCKVSNSLKHLENVSIRTFFSKYKLSLF